MPIITLPDGNNLDFSQKVTGLEVAEKISKSKGNGISIDDWLKYSIEESLSMFMYQRPTTAKKLYFDVVPKTVDEYLSYIEKYSSQDIKEKILITVIIIIMMMMMMMIIIII